MKEFRFFKSLLYLVTVVLVACSTGHCRRDGTKIQEKPDPKPPAGYEATEKGNILVSKSDGSLQCGMRPGMSLDSMKSELSGIKVFSSEKKHDGLMRVQACGRDTGMMNVYEIGHQDLSKAQKAGFKIFKK